MRAPGTFEPPRTSAAGLRRAQRGGVWLWCLILVVAAAAVAGGLYYKDYSALAGARGELERAAAKARDGEDKAAVELYLAALERASAVSDMTPLNAPSTEAAAEAARGLAVSEARLALAAGELEGVRRALSRARELGAEAPIVDGDAYRSLVASETLKRMDAARYKNLQAFLVQARAKKWLPEATGAELEMSTRRGEARSRVRSLTRKVVARDWASVQGDLQAGKDLLKEYAEAFAGREEERADLEGEIARAVGAWQDWKKLEALQGMVRQRSARVAQEPKALGDWHSDGAFMNLGFSSPGPGAGPDYAAFYTELKESLASLAKRHAALKELALAYKDMSWIASEELGEGRVELLFIDRTEVSQGAFKAFMAAGGYDDDRYWTRPGLRRRYTGPKSLTDPELKAERPEDDYPVTGLSYYEAQAFAKWSKKRLPTIEEWWRSIPGLYPWGVNFQADFANFGRGEDRRLQRVRSLANNKTEAGVYDLLGNAWEWVSNPESADDIEAVRVGGAYNFPLDDLKRFAERQADAALDVQRRKLRELLTDAAVAPSAGGRDTGFRLVQRLRWNRVLGAPE